MVVKTLRKYKVAFGLKTLVRNHWRNHDVFFVSGARIVLSNEDQVAIRELYPIRTRYAHPSIFSPDMRRMLLLIKYPTHSIE